MKEARVIVFIHWGKIIDRRLTQLLLPALWKRWIILNYVSIHYRLRLTYWRYVRDSHQAKVKGQCLAYVVRGDINQLLNLQCFFVKKTRAMIDVGTRNCIPKAGVPRLTMQVYTYIGRAGHLISSTTMQRYYTRHIFPVNPFYNWLWK